jgi:hypothetical protein
MHVHLHHDHACTLAFAFLLLHSLPFFASCPVNYLSDTHYKMALTTGRTGWGTDPFMGGIGGGLTDPFALGATDWFSPMFTGGLPIPR